MNHPAEYFQIPNDYAQFLGLEWSDDLCAIEHSAPSPYVGLTFVLVEEIALFLDGFHSTHRPIHFAYILMLMHTLAGAGHMESSGRRPLFRRFLRLETAFTTGRTKRPWKRGAVRGSMPRCSAARGPPHARISLRGSLSEGGGLARSNRTSAADSIVRTRGIRRPRLPGSRRFN
jgi:hypothetical protein